MEILFSYDFLDIWDNLARINENKNGKKYKFPDSFILIIGHIRVCLHLPYRQTEGLIKATIGKSIPEDKRPPQVIHRPVEEQTNWTSISIAGIDDEQKTSLSWQ